MSDASDSKPGVWASLKRMLDTMLAAAQNRLELFVVELQEEKCRLVETLLCVAAFVAFAMMALMMVTLTVVIVFWDSWRLTALGVITAFNVLGAALAWRGMRARLNSRSAFEDTLNEIRKDRACLDLDK